LYWKKFLFAGTCRCYYRIMGGQGKNSGIPRKLLVHTCRILFQFASTTTCTPENIFFCLPEKAQENK
jgi:hypothetical protein